MKKSIMIITTIAAAYFILKPRLSAASMSMIKQMPETKIVSYLSDDLGTNRYTPNVKTQ